MTMIALLFTLLVLDSTNATVRWDANIEADLAGYRVYFGKSMDSLSVMYVGNVLSSELRLEDGIYYFAVTAIDFSGNESGFSKFVVKRLQDDKVSDVTASDVFKEHPHPSPNPFTFEISFTCSCELIKIFNGVGGYVFEFIPPNAWRGINENGAQVATGVYFSHHYRGRYTKTIKITLLR